MAKNGRPPSSLDEWLDWKQRFESQKASGLSVAVFCLQEGVSLSTFYRWQQQLKDGIPAALLEEEVDRRRIESEEVDETTFLPISLKASPVEIELPNGGVVRLPLGVGQAALIAVIEAAGSLRPWKAPTS
jgi:translation elongation factor EF-G